MNEDELRDYLNDRVGAEGKDYWERIDAVIGGDSSSVSNWDRVDSRGDTEPNVIRLTDMRNDRTERNRSYAVLAGAAVLLVVAGFAIARLTRAGEPLVTAEDPEPTTVATEPDPGNEVTDPDPTPDSSPDPTAIQNCGDGAVYDTTGRSVAFYAFCIARSGPYPVFRDLQGFTLQDRLEIMVSGLTAEEEALGLFSPFSGEDLTVKSMTASDGLVALVFESGGEPWVPAGSTSSQMIAIVDPIYATVFDFSQATAIAAGSMCWGELDCSRDLTREEWLAMNFVNNGALSSCDSAAAVLQPSDCTVSGIALDADRTADPNRSGVATVVGVDDGDTLKVRSGPGTAFIEVGELDPGTGVIGTDIFNYVGCDQETAACGGLWRFVYDSDDPTTAGWVNNAFLADERNANQQLADEFVAFTKSLSPSDRGALPFADQVALGLGPLILDELPAERLSERDAWNMSVPFFRGGGEEVTSIIGNVSRLDNWRVWMGEHNHCAGAPMPAPKGYEEHTRLSIQPIVAPPLGSCLQWFTVDLFVRDGKIEAVTFDRWEP